MIKVERKWFSCIARFYNKNKSSIFEILKNKNEIRSSFSVSRVTATVTATVRDKKLIKVGKTSNIWVEGYVNKKRRDTC